MKEIQIKSISWVSPEYIQKERSIDWFWSIGLVSLIGAGFAIYFHNYLFGVLILVSGGMFFLLSIHTPRDMSCSISNEDGIAIGDKKYPLNSIMYFNIKKTDGSTRLFIYTSDRFMPIKNVNIPPEMTTDIEDEMSKFAEKKELDDSHAVKFMDKLGF